LALGALVCGGVLVNQAVLSVAAEPAKAAAADKDAAKTKARVNRLPAHYGEVVDAKQRESIYAIQGQYAEKIAQLKAELDAALKQRDAKIEAVLAPEQRQKVADLAAAAKAKRERAKEDAKPATKAPAAAETKASK
jgi:Spy/CpxP family protein refolding chaperone